MLASLVPGAPHTSVLLHSYGSGLAQAFIYGAVDETWGSAVQDNDHQLLLLSKWMANAALQAAEGSQRPCRAGAASHTGQNMPCRAILRLASCVASTSHGRPQRRRGAAPASGTGSCKEVAQQLLRLCAAVPSEQKAEAVPATVLVLVRVIQPVLARMLDATEADVTSQQSASQAAQQADHATRWRFLLGNTLPRMLERMQLPEDRTVLWWRTAAGLIQLPGSNGTSSVAGMPDQEPAGAACELALVMLSELCMGQAPHAAVAMLRRWGRGDEGALRKAMADMESLHARAVSIDLELI